MVVLQKIKTINDLKKWMVITTIHKQGSVELPFFDQKTEKKSFYLNEDKAVWVISIEKALESKLFKFVEKLNEPHKSKMMSDYKFVLILWVWFDNEQWYTYIGEECSERFRILQSLTSTG